MPSPVSFRGGIDQASDMPSATTYRNRFGSLALAYELIDYRTDRDHRRIALNKCLPTMHPEIIARTEAAIAAVGGTVARDPKTDLMTISSEMLVSLVLARCQPMGDGAPALASPVRPNALTGRCHACRSVRSAERRRVRLLTTALARSAPARNPSLQPHQHRL